MYYNLKKTVVCGVNMDTSSKVSVIDSTVEKIKQLIISGQYGVGDKLPTEKEFCEKFNVGRSTVREALSMLKAMGMVSTSHGKGAFVERDREESPETIAQWFMMKEQELNDFMEVRCSIEILNIKYTILRCTSDKIQELELIHNRFENAIMRGDTTKMATLDEAFHLTIANMTNNSLLINFNKHIADTLRPYRLRSFASPSTAYNAVLPHQQIIQAIKEKDIEKGVEAIKNHIDISLKDISFMISNLSNQAKED
jgi:GntR family transcriptional repressor for pyruvate dehydrogenase complex